MTPTPQVSAVGLEAAAEWTMGRGVGEGPTEDMLAVTGGIQNVHPRCARAWWLCVPARGPRQLRPRNNSVIPRGTKSLAAPADSDAPHPHPIVTCDDPGALGAAVFSPMDPVDGFNAGDSRLRFGTADFLQWQVPRRLSGLDSFRPYENYPGPQIPSVDRVAARLEPHRPARWTPGTMHGGCQADGSGVVSHTQATHPFERALTLIDGGA